MPLTSIFLSNKSKPINYFLVRFCPARKDIK